MYLPVVHRLGLLRRLREVDAHSSSYSAGDARHGRDVDVVRGVVVCEILLARLLIQHAGVHIDVVLGYVGAGAGRKGVKERLRLL